MPAKRASRPDRPRPAPASPPPSWAILPDDKAVARYLGHLPLPTRVIAAELDAHVRTAVPRVIAGIKWGVPFYGRKGPICYLSAAKTHVIFALLRGVEIEDHSGRLVGTGRSPIRKVTIKSGEDIEALPVRAWLKQALALDPSWGED